MSKDLTFHLTDEQWQEILNQLRNERIEGLEKEVERLRGWMSERNWVDTQGKSAVEVVRERDALRKEGERFKGPPGPKKCGCGGSVRDVEVGCFPWACRPDEDPHTFYLRDGWRCIRCGEELKA